MIVKCQQCGKEFKVYPYQVKKGEGKFCSKECSNLAHKIRIKRICQNCGKEFEVTPSQIRKGYGKFCSRKCSSLAQRIRVKKNVKHAEKNLR